MQRSIFNLLKNIDFKLIQIDSNADFRFRSKLGIQISSRNTEMHHEHISTTLD